MNDIVSQVGQVQREVRISDGPSTVVLRRTYDASIEDVWDAITSPERIERWFLPVSGELRLGGRYQLEGNAGGEIVRCEKPRLLQVTWEYGGQSSDVEVRLTATPDGDTEFVLEHSAMVDAGLWSQFGPGAVGIGWDLTVLGLSMHLQGEHLEDKVGWTQSPVAREFMTASGLAWGEAHLATGADPDLVKVVTENTLKAYMPDENAG